VWCRESERVREEKIEKGRELIGELEDEIGFGLNFNLHYCRCNENHLNITIIVMCLVDSV
jgi:hypothetical protein